MQPKKILSISVVIHNCNHNFSFLKETEGQVKAIFRGNQHYIPNKA